MISLKRLSLFTIAILFALTGAVPYASAQRQPARLGPARWKVKALAIGIVHGLAGSGALTLLVMQQLPTLSSGLAYIAVFGAGPRGTFP